MQLHPPSLSQPGYISPLFMESQKEVEFASVVRHLPAAGQCAESVCVAGSGGMRNQTLRRSNVAVHLHAPPQYQHVLTHKEAHRGRHSGDGSKQHASHALPPVPPSCPPLCEQLFSMLFFRSLRRMDGLKPMLVPLNS